MKRIVLIVATLLLTLGVLALPAMAHGGQFRGPGDSVPPRLREPSDPTPPPPPPPTTPATPTPPTPGVTPGPVTPVPPGNKAPTTGLPGRSNPGRSTGPRTSFSDWTFWYHNNKSDIENLKESLYRRFGSGGGLFQSGDAGDAGDTGGSSAATRLTQRQIETTIIPALLWAMDPKNSKHQDTESAAYLALAKVARDPEHIQTIMKGLDPDKKHSLIVRESAALALGVIRRAKKENQFSARELDQVRDRLFQVFQSRAFQARTRGFAAVAIGLLGDQPTGSGEYAGDQHGAAARTTQKLFDLLRDKYANQDLDVGLLMAIGLQPATSVTKDQRDVLADAALKGRLYKDNLNPIVRSYAAHTLGRIGTANDGKTLESILTARRGMPKNVQRSAAIGLGLLGRQVAGAERVAVAKTLLKVVDKSKDASTKSFAIISLSYLLIDDIKAQTTDVMGNTAADERLLELAHKGSYLERPWGALALGLVLREIDDDVEIAAYQQYKVNAQRILRTALTSTKLDKKSKAAFATAVGIAQDTGAIYDLIEILNNKRGDKMLRSYAALGLGLIGIPSREVVKAIAASLRERSSEELRRQSAVALGLLGNQKIRGTGKTAIELLVDELRTAKSQNHKGQVVLALATIGDAKAVKPLEQILRNPNEQDLTRALACAGLGLVGDLELMPSLSRASKHVNYRASTDLVNELLSIL